MNNTWSEVFLLACASFVVVSMGDKQSCFISSENLSIYRNALIRGKPFVPIILFQPCRPE